MFDTLGKAAIRFAWAYVRHRYRREFRIGIGIAHRRDRRRRLPGQPQRARGLSLGLASFLADY